MYLLKGRGMTCGLCEQNIKIWMKYEKWNMKHKKLNMKYEIMKIYTCWKGGEWEVGCANKI